MSLLEYASHTVPDLMKKATLSFYNDDALMKLLKARGNVKRSGGSKVRLKRIISGHSDVVQINGSNLSVPLNKKQTFSNMEGDWGRLIKPIILPHPDLSRMRADQKKEFVRDTTTAVVSSLRNDLARRIYIGSTETAAKLSDIGTLNGGTSAAPNSNGTSAGLTNGALMFSSPANQSGAASYLDETRVLDAVRDENNWYNQHVEHSGIGTDFLSSCEHAKLLADSYAEEGGVELVIISIEDQVAVADEVRSTSGGNNSPLVYTMADWEKGNIHKPIIAAGGMMFHSNRWMTAAKMGDYSGGSALPEVGMGLNPNYVEFWVNAGNDFRVTKFHDGLDTSNVDADIAYCVLEVQLALPALLPHFTTYNPA